MTDELLYEKRDHVAYLTLNRPEAMNAFDPVLSRLLGEAWLDFRDDPELWVAIVTGAKSDRELSRQAFCAGNDLKASAPRPRPEGEPPPSRAASFFQTGRGSIMRGLEIWKPIIAAVNGYALGGGLEMMLACDIRIASENATFGLTEARIASLPGGGGTQRLPRQIPYAIAMYMLLTGERMSAEEAYRVGLISKVVPPDQLMDEAEHIAGILKSNGPLSLRAIKQAAVKGLDGSLDSGLLLEQHYFNLLFDTEDRAEGRIAFGQKRQPEYQGR
jgi:enoyl-CoA hydratase/carnithine racemase